MRTLTGCVGSARGHEVDPAEYLVGFHLLMTQRSGARSTPACSVAERMIADLLPRQPSQTIMLARAAEAARQQDDAARRDCYQI